MNVCVMMCTGSLPSAVGHAMPQAIREGRKCRAGHRWHCIALNVLAGACMYVTYEFVYWQPSAADALLPKSSLSVTHSQSLTHSLTVTHRHSPSLTVTATHFGLPTHQRRRRTTTTTTTNDDDNDADDDDDDDDDDERRRRQRRTTTTTTTTDDRRRRRRRSLV